jgi:hypothetical protein
MYWNVLLFNKFAGNYTNKSTWISIFIVVIKVTDRDEDDVVFIVITLRSWTPYFLLIRIYEYTLICTVTSK